MPEAAGTLNASALPLIQLPFPREVQLQNNAIPELVTLRNGPLWKRPTTVLTLLVLSPFPPIMETFPLPEKLHRMQTPRNNRHTATFRLPV